VYTDGRSSLSSVAHCTMPVTRPVRIRSSHPLTAVLVATTAFLAVPHVASSTTASNRPPESVKDMFEVLRTAPPVALPTGAARTLARLRARAPGRRIALELGETRRIGRKGAALFLVPGTNGVCAVHGARGACSDDLAALSEHGLRFWVVHRRDAATGRRPIDLYGALPDGLGAISAMPAHRHADLRGTNAYDNGYRLRLPGAILWMILTGPRGAVHLGPLDRPG